MRRVQAPVPVSSSCAPECSVRRSFDDRLHSTGVRAFSKRLHVVPLLHLKHLDDVSQIPRTLDSQEEDTRGTCTRRVEREGTWPVGETIRLRSAQPLLPSCATAGRVLQSLPNQSRKQHPLWEIVQEVHDASLSYV
jgi:hypothetical protein